MTDEKILFILFLSRFITCARMLVLCATVKLTPGDVPVPVPVIDTGTAPVQHRYSTNYDRKSRKVTKCDRFPGFRRSRATRGVAKSSRDV
jgi:hypothetical protein